MKQTFEQYLEQLIANNTLKYYMISFEKYKLRISNIEKAKYKDILDYIHRYKANHIALAVIKHYYNYLVENGIRDDHPCRRLYLKTKRSEVQHQDLFTVEELERLLERENRYKYLKQRNKVILSLLIYQGLTPENIIRLKVNEVNFDAGTIYIKATNKLHRRTLELKAKQMHILYRYIHECKVYIKGVYLFYTMRGEKLTIDTLQNIVEVMQPLFPDRELTLTKIRQSVISNWLNNDNISMEDVQLLAGHKWLSTTEKYQQQNHEQKRKLINRYFPL